MQPIGAPVVLLHGAYPYGREAGYLASVYPHVYVDYGLPALCLSSRGMRCALADPLDLAPAHKVMFSTDGHYYPETYYLGAKCGRELLAGVLFVLL